MFVMLANATINLTQIVKVTTKDGAATATFSNGATETYFGEDAKALNFLMKFNRAQYDEFLRAALEPSQILTAAGQPPPFKM